MDLLRPFLPIDRCHALAGGRELPARSTGAALFADVSGFTALAGQLVAAEGGKRGAEELLSRLNRVYQPLIATIHGHGGAVVSFAGDSITSWFDARPAGSSGFPPPALRAVTAAMKMQSAMANVGSPGELRIKIAVALGDARRLVAGDPAHCLLDALAGSPLDRMAAIQQAAAPGEVLVDGAIRAALESTLTCGAARPLDGVAGRAYPVSALATPAQPSPWPPLPAPLPVNVARQWVLPAVAERLAAGGGFLGELRQAVPLFAGVEGLDAGDDSESDRRLDAWVRWAQDTIASFGGAVIQLTIGDKGTNLYAAFGVPVAQEDAADRAAAASLALQAAPAGLGFTPRTRIGISQGPVWTGACGSSERQCYAVMGEPVNLAARLMARASPGVTLVDRRIAHLAGRHRFSVPSDTAIKGRSEPVSISTLLGRSKTPATGSRPAAAFVGRQEELARLEPLLSATLDGGCRAVVVEGVAGIGKSRLIGELAESAGRAGLRVLRGAGDPVERLAAYHGWQPVFSALFGLPQWTAPSPETREAVLHRLRGVDPGLERHAPLLNAVLPLDFEDTAITAQMEAATRAENTLDLLATLAEKLAGGPALLVLEDAHWLDSGSWALLAALRRRSPPLLVVVATRPLEELASDTPLHPALEEVQAAAGTVHLRLEALPATSAVALACGRLGVDALPLRIAALVERRAEGNPLYVEELVSALLQANLIRIQGGRCLLDDSAGDPSDLLPETLEGLVTSRLDRLSSVSQRAAKVASVIGREFSVELLEAVYPVPEERPGIAAALEELAKADIARRSEEPQPSYRFKHAISHDAVYGTLLFAQRQELHRAVARWFEGQGGDLAPLYPVLAHHWERAEAPDEAVHYGELAGEQALRSFANREAASFFGRVLARLDTLTADSAGALALRRARALRRLGLATYALGDTAVASSRLEASLAALGHPWPRTRLGVLGRLCEGMARQLTHRYLPVAAAGPSPREAAERQEMAGALGTLIRTFYPTGDVLGAVTANFLALNLAERAGGGHDVAGPLATAYTNVGAALDNVLGLQAAAGRYYQRARAVADGAGDLHALANLEKVRGMIFTMTRRLDRAAEPFERSAALHAELGDARGWEEVCFCHAGCAMASGDLHRALEMAEAVVASGRRRDSVQSCVLGLAQLAQVLLRLGRLEDAEDAAAESWSIPAKERYPAERIYARGVLAHALALQGRGGEAAALLEQVAMLAEEVGLSTIAAEGYVSAGEAAVLLLDGGAGAPPPGRERLLELGALVNRPLARTGRFMARLYTPPADRVSGGLAAAAGRSRVALRLWRRSLARAAQDGQRWDEAEAAFALARHHPSAAERRGYAARAGDLYRAMGATERIARLDLVARNL